MSFQLTLAHVLIHDIDTSSSEEARAPRGHGNGSQTRALTPSRRWISRRPFRSGRGREHKAEDDVWAHRPFYKSAIPPSPFAASIHNAPNLPKAQPLTRSPLFA